MNEINQCKSFVTQAFLGFQNQTKLNDTKNKISLELNWHISLMIQMVFALLIEPVKIFS